MIGGGRFADHLVQFGEREPSIGERPAQRPKNAFGQINQGAVRDPASVVQGHPDLVKQFRHVSGGAGTGTGLSRFTKHGLWPGIVRLERAQLGYYPEQRRQQCPRDDQHADYNDRAQGKQLTHGQGNDA